MREAIHLDQDGYFPKSMLLLSAIFEQQGNAGDTVVEYKARLRLASHGSEAPHVRGALEPQRRRGLERIGREARRKTIENARSAA